MRDPTVRGKRSNGTKFKMKIDNWVGMRSFSIQGQQLVEIDLHNLMYGCNLETINLSENQLSELDLLSLKFCRNLVSLDLSKNNLRGVDLSSLRSDQAGTHFLESIDLSSNSISDLDLNDLTKCYNLLYLNLVNNDFQQLDLSPLTYCKNLEELIFDDGVKIEWRNTNLDTSKLPVGLKVYSIKIKTAWNEFCDEVDLFRKTEPQVEERMKRAKWLETLEKQKDFDWTKIFSFSRPIYSEVRNSYIYGCYRGTISIIFSLMESFLTNELPFEDLEQEKKFQKKHDNSKSNEKKKEVDPLSLNFSKLASFAKKKGYISPELYKRIYMYLPVRHGVIHYSDITIPLGFYRKSISGTGVRARGASFESPDGQLILPLKLKEAAETGIELFLDLLAEFKI